MPSGASGQITRPSDTARRDAHRHGPEGRRLAEGRGQKPERGSVEETAAEHQLISSLLLHGSGVSTWRLRLDHGRLFRNRIKEGLATIRAQFLIRLRRLACLHSESDERPGNRLSAVTASLEPICQEHPWLRMHSRYDPRNGTG